MTTLKFAVPLTLALATLTTPRAVEACGGTFCDAGPTEMPVDQTGESIVFWIDDSGAEPFTEAHIQIQYEGAAERFAWIIPVMSAPEVFVGSQALFDNVLQATRPTFVTQSRSVGDCGFGGFGCASDLASLGGRGDEGNEGDGNIEILDRGFAGAFEYVTLTGDSVEQIVEWLDVAGYAQDPEAPPILEEYLQEGFVFVAVKLRSGAEVEEIHPLAIRYAGVEACIPIRLTRIAAIEDMAIRALFLGSSRVAPQNWPHVELNHARIDYPGDPARSYAEIVSLAIDEAGGRAWVTEYAGPDSIVSTTGLDDPRWNPAAFVEIEALAVIEELTSQGLLGCETNLCEFNHVQVETLLEIYLPPPDGVPAHTFWSCLGCYAEQIDPLAWDPAKFAEALDERVVTPGRHALEMLVDADYLTRLYTVISPHEMLEDPLFHETEGLPEVPSSFNATRVNDCDGGPTVFELPDGRSVALTDAGDMPELGLPAAALIQRIPAMGPPQVEVDNTAQIDAALEAHNAANLSGPAPSCSVRPGRFEGFLTMFSVFGIAWLSRGRRRRTWLS